VALGPDPARIRAEVGCVLPERIIEHGCPMVDVGAGTTLHTGGLCYRAFDPSFLSGEVCGSAYDLFANRPKLKHAPPTDLKSMRSSRSGGTTAGGLRSPPLEPRAIIGLDEAAVRLGPHLRGAARADD
jgi:hypothetical protein